MVAINTVFLSIFIAFVSFFGYLEDDIKSIDFNNVKIEITGEQKVGSEIENISRKFTLRGIKEDNKANYKLKIDSNEKKNINLDYYFDGENTYFNKEALTLVAGERASESLKEIEEEYVKVKGNEAFGFEERYNLNLITNYLDLLNDKKFLESAAKVAEFFAKSPDFPKIKEKDNVIKFDIVGIMANEKLNSYLAQNYKEVKNELTYIGNKVLGSETINDEYLEMIFNGDFNKYLDEVKKAFEGSYIKIKYNDSKNIDVDLEVKINLNGESKEESTSFSYNLNLKIKNTDEKIKMPVDFKEVSSLEYSKFFLSTYSDVAVINIKGEDGLYSISYDHDNKPKLIENSIYVDRHVIEQMIKDSKLKDKIEIKEDFILINGKKINSVDGLYPLRKLAESMGYKVEYEMSEDFPRFYIELNK